MGATKDIADWLEAQIVADVGVTCAKGFSTWSRPAIGTSNAYIEWASDEPEYNARLGKTLDKSATTFTAVFVSSNEIGLWALVDLVRAMARSNGRATINSQPMHVIFSAISRAEPSEETIEALRYAAVATVRFQFSQ